MTSPFSTLEQPKRLPDGSEALHVATRRQLEERRSERSRASSRKPTFLAWSMGIKEARGPLDLKNHAFQRQFYDEEIVHADEVVWMKATQVGISTYSTRLALFHADVYQRNMIYTFPVDKDLQKFSKQRIGPLIARSPELLQRMTGVNTVDQKQFGEAGWVYFFGLQSPVDSVDADGLIIDEYDDSDPSNVEKTLPRITGPMSLGMLRMLGVPLIPGKGIAQKYRESDQRVWTVPCSRCSTWNPIHGKASFDANFNAEDPANPHLMCKKCRRPIDVRVGEWVARHPDRSSQRIGYALSKLLMPSKRTLALIADASKKTAPHEIEAFRQRHLGEDYASADSRLSLEQVKECVDPDLRPLERLATDRVVTMGVDVSSTRGLNVTIEEDIDGVRGRKVYVDVIDGNGPQAFEQLCRLMVDFNVTMAVVDKLPEGFFAMALAAQFPGRVYQANLFDAQPGARKEPPAWDPDHQARTVGLWRTRVYDFMFSRYRNREVILPPLDTLHPDFAEQLGNLLRVVERDPDTSKVTIRYRKIGAEDFGQTEAYNAAARELVRMGYGVRMAGAGQRVSLADEFEGPYGAEDVQVAEYRQGFELDM